MTRDEQLAALIDSLEAAIAYINHLDDIEGTQ
jgi:hypothetical protein